MIDDAFKATWRRQFTPIQHPHLPLLATLIETADKLDAARGFIEPLSNGTETEREHGMFVGNLAIRYAMTMLDHFGLGDGDDYPLPIHLDQAKNALTNSDSLNLIVTDPVTGVVTKIIGSDDNVDNFSDDDGIRVTDTTSSTTNSSTGSSAGSSTSTSETDTAHAIANDRFTDTRNLLVSVQGNPSAGLTIDFVNNLGSIDKGVNTDDEELPSLVNGTGTETDQFSSSDTLKLTESGHSNLHFVVNTDDGHGNTVSIDEWARTNFGITGTGTLTNTDNGQESVNESSNKITADNEEDTATQSGEIDPFAEKTTNANDKTTAVDPITGLRTTVWYFDNGSTDNRQDQETESLTDVHGQLLGQASTDVCSGTDIPTETKEKHQDTGTKTTTVGTDSNGQIFNLLKISSIQGDETDTSTNTETAFANGIETAEIVTRISIPDLLTRQAITGTIATIDPATGIRTTITLNDITTGTSVEMMTSGDNVVTTAGSGATDAPTLSENSQSTVTWNHTDLTTVTDARGNLIGTPITTQYTGSDTQSLSNGVVTAESTTINGTTYTAGQDLLDDSRYVGKIFIDPSGAVYVETYCTFAAAHTQDGSYYRQIGDVAPNLGQGWTTAQWQDFMRMGTRRQPGTTTQYKSFAGDAAASWSDAKKFTEALKYGIAKGTLGKELSNQLQQILDLAGDPQALIRMVAMIAATAAAKKAACKAGLTGPAAAAFTAAQVAETALKMAEIKFELDGITYESEVANAAPLVVNTVVDLIKSVGFLELMKLLKCFAAGTQVVVATEQINGVWNYRTAAIETLKVGDLVLAREEYGSQIKQQRVEETFVRFSDHLRVLEFRDVAGSKQTIKTTDERPIWSHDQAKYILANALAVGANVIGPNGELQTLVDSRREEFAQGTRVYNFRVSEYQTYYVSGTVDALPFLVHNAKYARGGETAAAAKGRLEHEKFRQRVGNKPGWQPNPRLVDPVTGKTVIPDAITPSGRPVELKPNTRSGRAAGKAQLKKYERATGKKGRLLYYDS